MAKRIIRRPKGKKPIKNSSLIGAGTPFKAVKNSSGKTLFAPSIMKQRGQAVPRPTANYSKATKPLFRASIKGRAVSNKQAAPTQRSVRLPKASGVSSSALRGKMPPRPAPKISRGPKR